jgi:ABC-type glycerol-3-phosphate transport system permease component
MAATVVALFPTLVIYFIAQEFFIEGIAASGIKG